MDAMQIGLSGMDVEWRRLEIISQNLANMNTTRTALGEPYLPQRLISGPRAGFADYLEEARQGGAEPGVMVYGVEETGAPVRLVHDPDHPHADDEGYVTYPGVDHAGEMVLMIQAARAYEANMVAITAARQMYMRAMELGKQ